MGKTKDEGGVVKPGLEAFIETRSKHRRAKKKSSAKAAGVAQPQSETRDPSEDPDRRPT